MIMAAAGVTKPLAGVIPTRPATAPEIAPSTHGLPLRDHSAAIHPITPAAVAKYVVTNAVVARSPALSALPALQPNHPTQSTQAPMKLSTSDWGGDCRSG